MKKRFAAVFAATAVLGVTTAFAANPFSDVTPSDWAYQSVSQLAAAGVINGYPDGTFQGQKNITRYEMAQMVAKAMANEARANAEQQAMINRLADEFSSELNNLGVRVANLENKVGNVKVTGDMRLRYKGTEKEDQNGFSGDKKSKFDFRGRIQFNATVNENTSATVRLTTGDHEFGDADDGNGAEIDNAYVTHNFGKDFSLTAGRFDAFIGNGLIYDDVFDGASLAYNGEKVNASVTHGYFMAGDLFKGIVNEKDTPQVVDFENSTTDKNLSATVFQVNGKIGTHATLGAFYALANQNGEKWGEDLDIYGASLDLNFNKVWVGGEYATFKSDFKDFDPDYGNDNDAWVAGIGYGDYDMSKEGTWGVKVQYFDEGVYSPVISSTFVQPYRRDYKAWMATVNYALAKNVGLSAYYAFNAENQDGEDLGDFYRAQLNYKF
ncbi:putative porin [uncultured Veillonella sp.]|uniref:putative porin n=1 Tax=uncultured Veillonella sp. TaxID=159268 RepID=UPI0025948424|nr:putative porin [uncultured Veillonella sp.]